VVSVVTTTGGLLIVSLAGYAFARLEFPGHRIMFAVVIATMLVPGWSTIIASYALTRMMGLHDTFWALILPGLAGPFGLFLFRQFAVSLPEELFQAARIDGASEFGLWWRIAMPLCRPVIATLGIFTIVGVWNDFLWPLLVLNKVQLYTVPVGVALLMYQFQMRGPDYGLGLAVALLMSVLPVVAFLLMQRQMIKGLTLGSLKG
jgi:multiple sugar transport system permease protein